MLSTTTQRLSLIAALSASALLLSACAGDDPQNGNGAEEAPAQTTTAIEADPEIQALLPERIREAGTLRVGTEAYYPPYEYFDDDQETIIGLDPAIDKAIGQVLGVEVEIENMAFDGLLPALDSGRFDVISAALGATPERIEKYDFVSYFNATQGITTTADNPKNVTSRDDLCGLNVSVLDASHQLDLLEAMNEDTCAADPISINAFPTDSDALQQLQNGRADAHLAQFAVADYSAKTFGDGEQFAVVSDETFGPYLLGKVVRKDDTELRDALQAAVNHLIESGAYAEILETHELPSGAITESQINQVG